jgi:uncharacterized protein YdeI (YjbR/CyaY-like superfamily)
VKPRFFPTAAAFRAWLEKNHASTGELFVGFYKKRSQKKGISYTEAVDEALCFGWIDGVKKRVDEDAYTHRFTPRKGRSCWSAVNVARAKELIAAGRMAPAGLAAFEKRDAAQTARYSVERAAAQLSAAQLKMFKADAKAWAFFISQPPYYRRVATFWIVSAKKEETRTRRLETLIASSAAGRRLDMLAPSKPI